MNDVQTLELTMKPDRNAKREDLQERLVAAAEARIGMTGLTGLRARDVTADAGCAVGALYTAFKDLDDLIVHVNSRTLARLGGSLDGQLLGADDPRSRFQALARAYFFFARDNQALWQALFEHRMVAGNDVPDWHRAEQAVLIQQLVEPLSILRPTLAMPELLARARTLFSAVHGIVAISLEKRFVGLAPSHLESELRQFVDVLVTGIENTPQA